MSARITTATLMTLVWAAPGLAHAYSDPSMFEAPIAEGGGGGRWFTGSPGDGYTCAVCHDGGPSTQLEVLGWPVDGYQPGAMYEVIVDWPDDVEHVGIGVEVTDEDGAAAGTITLPEASTLDDREKCIPFGAGISATFSNTFTDTKGRPRNVISVADCGARRLRVLWTAPPQPRGQLWLSGALVRADGSTTVSGDGVTDFARPVTSEGGNPIASSVGGCSVSPQHVAHAGWLAGWALLSLLGARSRSIRGRERAR